MDMSFEAVAQTQTQFAQKLLVAIDIPDYRINQGGLTRCRICDQVGVGPGVVIKKLAKEHECPPLNLLLLYYYLVIQ